jgi:hypothetical protein
MIRSGTESATPILSRCQVRTKCSKDFLREVELTIMLANVDSVILNAIELINIFLYLLSSPCNKFHTHISNRYIVALYFAR